jgi:hypothetical protein
MRVFGLGFCVILAANLLGKLGWALKFKYIKLPVYLFNYMALELNDFDAGPEIENFLAQMCV